MRSAIKFFMILLTISVIIFARLTHRLEQPAIQLLILALIVMSVAAFIVMNAIEERENRARRRARESVKRDKEAPDTGSALRDRDRKKVKRSDASFAIGERKSGLTWGGGNILASDATRGTRRKFLRK